MPQVRPSSEANHDLVLKIAQAAFPPKRAVARNFVGIAVGIDRN
jgi:hypothetical protein